jgi:F-type H+-transporting ATPase subunit delta
MAHTSTIARPYARAAFETARDAKDLAGWQAQLEFVAAVVADPAMQAAIGSPKASADAISAVITEAGKGRLSAGVQNLVVLLARRKRLAVLPELVQQFVALKREAERKVEVELTSAVALGAGQRSAIQQALEQRLGRTVELKEAVDASLIGGAVVRAGDLVIDASVRGRLERLGDALIR